MQRTDLFAALGILFLLVGCTYLQSTQGPQRIPKDELKAKLGSPSLLLLDVRSPVDWDSSSEKIVGAKRMEPDKVDVWVEAVPKDKETILYCA